jgi:uncharacterized membrane protein
VAEPNEPQGADSSEGAGEAGELIEGEDRPEASSPTTRARERQRGSALDIPEELVEIIEHVDDPEQRVEAIVQLAASYWSWKGPLPPPQLLARYNDAFPDCAERIVAMAEGQSQHRQDLERQVVKSDISLRKWGQVCGFVIAMTVIIGGLLVIDRGAELTGFGSVLLGVAGLVGLFLYSRRQEQRDLQEKQAALAAAGDGESDFDDSRAVAPARSRGTGTEPDRS